ncbi:hypothetical protein ACA910_013329 [Epithemia clementina (nom. ined.)]
MTDAKSLNNRRQALEGITTATMGLLTFGTTAVFQSPEQAGAFDKAYPTELVEPELGSIQDGRERALQRVREQEAKRVSRLELGPGYKPLSSVLWGAVLWLWTGSRSNPVVTPLANLVFDPAEEEWLKDRNDGLFADLPPTLYALLAVVFVAAGFVVDTILVTLTEGDRNVALQLAGVSLISGAALEVGRLASGQKKQTREESDRSTQLEQEFAEFAENRLKLGGNVHRSEVVQAFRRYFAKYRMADNPDYPLGDLEIEQLLRAWSKRQTMAKVERSQAGFYSGIQINRDADVFVQRR